MIEPASSHAKSALRALDILELLARHVAPVPTGSVSRECGIPRSSTHHLLNALYARGFITYYESEHAWGIGPKILEVSQGYHRSEPMQRLAGPVLDRLVHRVKQTAHLAILVGDEVLYLAKRQPQGPAPVLVTEVGIRLPAHLAATGQAILASMVPEQVSAIYFGNKTLPNRTGTGPRTICDLQLVLGEVRQRGFAVERGSVSRGISCAAAGVRASEGLPAAAVGLTWIDAAHTDHEVEEFITAVQWAAHRLGRLINGGGTCPPLPGTAPDPPRCSRGKATR